jgi:hypothetical protein
MYLFLEDTNNKYENSEIYGSWNNWKKPIKISEYNYIINNIKIFTIETDDTVISYKIKINNEYILLNNLLIAYDNGFENNKIILTEDNYYYNGKFKIKFDENNMLNVLYDDNIMYLCINDEEYWDYDDEKYETFWDNAEIYGSWDNWKYPIKITDYDFIIDNIKIFIIKTNDLIISYKIKYNNEYILLNSVLITIDNGFENNVIILTEDNYYYNGQIKIKNINNKMEIFYENNLLLDVETKNGIPNGYGNQYYKQNDIYSNNKLYEGEWQNGKFNGKGSHYWHDYKVYEGEWLNGLCHGKGIGFISMHENINEQNEYYEGEWNNGEYHGQGIYYINDKKSYEGEWVNGYYHGQGISYQSNGNKCYKGEWQNGKYHGQGTDYYTFDTYTKCYVGEFHDGRYHGNGIMYHNKGHKTYEGEWLNGVQHGKGIEYFENGNKSYEGEYINRFKFGKGILYHKNGNKYFDGELKWSCEGEWANRLKYGKGILYDENGYKNYDGEFNECLCSGILG